MRLARVGGLLFGDLVPVRGAMYYENVEHNLVEHANYDASPEAAEACE